MEDIRNELAIFAGAGGGILASGIIGHRVVGAIEIDSYARRVLVARQNGGDLPPFWIWDDVRTFDGRPWRGIVDVISGGFPCKSIARCNPTARGMAGYSGEMWAEMARIVGEVQPEYVFMENSPALTFRGLGKVLGDLAELGYHTSWGILGARHVGAPHRRDRIWILAHADCARCAQQLQPKPAPEAKQSAKCGDWWKVEPALDRVVDELAGRVGQLRSLGNGQVPPVAALAWDLLRCDQ